MATRELAERCEHRLFLSATPHNGYSESFTALLEMIDGRRFSRGAMLDEQALREVTVRRLKTELPEKGFKPRRINVIAFTPSDDEQERFAHARPHPHRERPGQRQGPLGRHRGDAAQEALPVQPVVVRPDTGALRRAATAGGLPDLDEDDDEYYQEVLGSGQSDEEEGDAEHPEFTALRQSKGSDPLVAATAQEIDAWSSGGTVRAQARLPAGGADHTRVRASTCRTTATGWSTSLHFVRRSR